MNNFGLGLILNFSDNATNGMNLAIGTFQRMSNSADQMSKTVENSAKSFQSLEYAGVAMTVLGNLAEQAGAVILNTFEAISMAVINVGSDFEKTRITLGTLFGDMATGEEKVQWMLQYAKSTPFNITSLKEAFVSLKAMGVDASNTASMLNGGQQELLSYIGDLKAFRPDLDMSTIVRGIRNAAGGTIRSLDMILDINSTNLLGHEFSNIEEDLPALVQALGVEGLMGNLEGTWEQMASNLEDVWLQFLLAISDAGAFDKAKEILGSFYNTVMSITPEDFARLGQTFTVVFENLAKPVKFVVDQLANFIMWIKEASVDHPELVQMILTITAIAGGFLFASGAVLRFIGPIVTTVGVLGMMIKEFGGLSKILGVLSKSFGGFSTLFIVGSALVLAYTTNFMGFRDFINNKLLPLLDNVVLVFEAVFSGVALTGDKFVEAKDRGLIPYIVALTDFKNCVTEFWDDNGEWITDFIVGGLVLTALLKIVEAVKTLTTLLTAEKFLLALAKLEIVLPLAIALGGINMALNLGEYDTDGSTKAEKGQLYPSLAVANNTDFSTPTSLNDTFKWLNDNLGFKFNLADQNKAYEIAKENPSFGGEYDGLDLSGFWSAIQPSIDATSASLQKIVDIIVLEPGEKTWLEKTIDYIGSGILTIQTYWDTFNTMLFGQDTTKSIWIVEQFKTLATQIQIAWDVFNKFLTQLGLTKNTNTEGTGITEGVGMLTSGMEADRDYAEGMATQVSDAITRKYSELPEKVAKIGGDTSTSLGDGIYSNNGYVDTNSNNVKETAKNGFLPIVKDLFNIGSDAISEMIKGLQSKDIGSVASGIVQDVLKRFLKGFGIASPSKEMFTIGGHIMQGLINGLTGSNLAKFVNNTVQTIKDAFANGNFSIEAALNFLGGNGADILKSMGIAQASLSNLGSPASGSITSGFGNRDSFMTDSGEMSSSWHEGIDIGAPYGSPVWAVGDGTVILSDWFGGYGNSVKIDHGNGLVSLYAHMSELLVSVGQLVKKGQEIGKVGSTGNSTGPHLHFGLYQDGVAIDPTAYAGFANGTNMFKGGLARINEKMGELVTLPTGTQILPHDRTVEVSKAQGRADAYKEMLIRNVSSGSNVPQHNDNSLNFESGSVIIHVEGTTDNDLENVAERLMKIIDRKRYLKGIGVRNSLFNK